MRFHCASLFTLLYECLWATYPTHLKRLILLQKRAVRIINKYWFEARIDPIFKDLYNLPLQEICI